MVTIAKHLTVLLVAAASINSYADEAKKPPAFRLGDVATPIAYESQLAIDPKAETFTGEIQINLRFNRATPILWLNGSNLEIESAKFRQHDKTIEAKATVSGEDFIGFEPQDGSFTVGEATATIRYKGKLDPLSTRGLFKQEERGEQYVLSQFEAISARRAFPCFDEPGWKTPWKLTIDAPASNVVVSNTPETSVGDTPDKPGWKRHAFVATKPLPSYLIALAVGPFEVVDGGTAGKNKTPLRYLAPKGRGNEVRWAKESTGPILEIMEAYFGSPYPFEKLDSVTIPQAVNFGAMENVGLVTYGSTNMLATPRDETEEFKRRYAFIAAHEIAHMWFGNLVTLAWWDDIWLNEAFATWMGNKAGYQFRPEWNTGERHAASRARAIATDRLASARRVRNPVVVKEDLSGAFDSITYNKGGEVLEMFEAWLGPDLFRKGVRDYMQRHAFGTATSTDFFRALGDASGRREDALKAFTAFVDQPGVPLMDLSMSCDGKTAAIEISQQRLRPAGSTATNMQWTTPACFRYGVAGRVETQCEEVTNPKRRITLTNAGGCPDWVIGNARGVGHFVTRYDPALTKRLLASAAKLPQHEAVTLVSDQVLLAESGLIPLETALTWTEAALGMSYPVAQGAGAQGLLKIIDEWLTIAGLKRKQDILGRRVQPLARALGWEHRPKDSDEVKHLRFIVVPFAAGQTGGEALRPRARELALAWLANRNAVDASMVSSVLLTAGRFADKAIYDKLEAATIATQERRERRWLLAALGKARDPQLRDRAFALMLEKKDGKDVIHGRDVQLFFEDALRDETSRRPGFAFVRANFDALVAKMPQHTPGQFTTYLSGLCKPEDRDQFVEFFKDRAAKFQGGQRRYNEALETIELCVAARMKPG